MRLTCHVTWMQLTHLLSQSVMLSSLKTDLVADWKATIVHVWFQKKKKKECNDLQLHRHSFTSIQYKEKTTYLMLKLHNVILKFQSKAKLYSMKGNATWAREHSVHQSVYKYTLRLYHAKREIYISNMQKCHWLIWAQAQLRHTGLNM